MKKYLAIAIMCLMTYLATGQDKRFTIFAYTDGVATLKDGFNAGVGIDYQMTIVYFKAQAFVFPKLRGNTYSEYTGSVGFNHHFGGIIEQPYRLYIGIKVGKINRKSGHGGGTIGFESGFDFTFPNTNFYTGIGGSWDSRTDGKAWGENEHNYWRLSGLIKIGFTF